MILLIFSSPFYSPLLHTKNPSITVSIIQNAICEQIRKYCRSIVRSHAGLEFAF